MSKQFINYCPHCKSIMHVNKIERSSDTSSRRNYRCTNDFCGFAVQAIESMIYTISPAANPRDGIDIPNYPRPNLTGPRPRKREFTQ